MATTKVSKQNRIRNSIICFRNAQRDMWMNMQKLNKPYHPKFWKIFLHGCKSNKARAVAEISGQNKKITQPITLFYQTSIKQ
jgi:hypothetical protein